MKQKIIAEKIKSSRKLVESIKPGGKKSLADTGSKKLKEVTAQIRVASELKAGVDVLKKQLKAKKEELAKHMTVLSDGRKALKKALKKAKPNPSITTAPGEPEKKVTKSVKAVKKPVGKTAKATVKRKPSTVVRKKSTRKL